MLFRIMALVACFMAPVAQAETRVPTSQLEIQLGFAPLVKEAAPAVVNIYAKRVVETRQSPFQGDPFFQNLFRDFGTVRPRVQNSLGSGVILSSDGIVVSNYHVVGMATDIRVVLNDRREFAATVLMADQESDLAILRLTDAPADMPYLSLRDSDTVEVGELALAIGNPFGVGQTVSSGIVSGLARSGTAAGAGQGYFLQTDAPINPGNSGGALIDVNGSLIGINTRILTRSGGSNGIGFAIPTNLVAEFMRQVAAGQSTFQRPWAGASGQPVDADIADTLGLDRPGGIMISALHDASPLHAAGIAPGDVILAVDGQPVNTGPEMIFRMSVAGLGAQAELTVLQAGEVKQHEVTLISPPEQPDRDTRTAHRRGAFPDLVMSNINPAVIAEYRLPLASTGVVIEDPGAAGARAGLRRGDVLLSLNGDALGDTKTAERALRKASGRITLSIQRGGQQILMRFRL